MGPATSAASYAGGIALVAVTAADVFFTVLFPASGRGRVRKPLSKATWRLFRALGGPVHGRRRRDLLSYSGPVLILVTITAWVVLLVLGWALVLWPMLGSQITAAKGPTDTSLTAALYYSGYTLTTVGLGDIAPTTPLARFLTVVEAAIGFATVSLVITYFLSVYSALTRRRSQAGLLHHATAGTGRADALLTSFVEADGLRGVREELRRTGAFVQEVCETHRSYPVLRYFHFRQPEYSLPRILLVSLDAASLLRACAGAAGGPAGHRVRQPALRMVDGAGRQLLDELVPDAGQAWAAAHRAAAERAFDAAWEVLEPTELARTDREQARDRYLRARSTWEPALRALAGAMLYEWAEVEPEPAGDARTALDPLGV